MQSPKIRIALATAWIVITVAGCASLLETRHLDAQYGAPDPRARVVSTLPAAAVDYWSEVQPLLDRRCVVCHGCYDAPCQLKLGAPEGIERGASGQRVYATRLTQTKPTRLFQDADTVEEWRELGFFPVVNERAQTVAAQRTGVMHRMLTLKAAHPLPAQPTLPDSFDLSLDRAQSCPTDADFDAYAEAFPLQGMPFALPGLAPDEQQTLLRWLEQGALRTPRPSLPAAFQAEVARWERFLNQDSRKARLVSRYLFEHLYLADLYFPALGERWFRLVRSSTPPGQPIEPIATRRPFNDPGVTRPWYRLQESPASRVAKTHMPYRLDDERMQRWQTLFFEVPYEVDSLPSYTEREAANPFLTFAALPVASRYRFMLDEAAFTIAAFMKGPVCRGQVALNVIRDHFWVFFVSPDSPRYTALEETLSEYEQRIDLPASEEQIFTPLSHWLRFRRQERRLIAARDERLRTLFSRPEYLNLDLFWNGDGHNPNAALTIFRHFDSASVAKGMVGPEPLTAWLIDYDLLERIHYLLVAGYDVFGNVGHQLMTRIYMDFLRMEGERNFLLFLPEKAREAERQRWYREADRRVLEFLSLPRFEETVQGAGIAYGEDDPKHTLFALLRARLQPVLERAHDPAIFDSDRLRQAFALIADAPARAATVMPETAFIEVVGADTSEYATILRTSAHLNIATIFGEADTRIPSEDRLVTLRGFVGAYPNALFRVPLGDLDEFAARVTKIETGADYRALVDAWGVRRTDPGFWPHSDALHDAYRAHAGAAFGWLDYSRLENR